MLEQRKHVATLTVMLQHGLPYDATSNACACKCQAAVNNILQRENELHTNCDETMEAKKATVSGFDLDDKLPLVDLSYIAAWTRNEVSSTLRELS